MLSGRFTGDVADGLGINVNMLARWKSESLASGELAFPGHGKQTELEEGVRKLHRSAASAASCRTNTGISRTPARATSLTTPKTSWQHRTSLRPFSLASTAREVQPTRVSQPTTSRRTAPRAKPNARNQANGDSSCDGAR